MPAAGDGAAAAPLLEGGERRQVGASCSWILPLRTHWAGLSAKELAQRDENRRLDAVVVPIFGVWYLAQALCVSAPDAAVQADAGRLLLRLQRCTCCSCTSGLFRCRPRIRTRLKRRRSLA